MTPADLARRLALRALPAASPRLALPVGTGATTLAVTWTREAERAYGVGVTPSWLTTVAVPARSATGCTLTFGTAAPVGATVDVWTFGSED